jgi:carbon-monoxide dehydrogenase large subunit
LPVQRLLNYSTGCYRIQHVDSEVSTVFTNTTPTGPYRGAGRPEAAFVAERAVDAVAAELGLDPIEVRRRNFIPPEAFPYASAGGVTYDSGDYARALDRALELADYAGLRREQATRRARGELVGVGLATYTEVAGGGFEMGTVSLGADGTVTAVTGSSPFGQGVQTVFAQIVADQFGVDPSKVRVVPADTDALPAGMGSFGSRSTALGGSALVQAARVVRDRALSAAAALLEVSPDDLELRDGTVGVRGVAERAVDLAEVSQAAGELRESVRFASTEGDTYPFGAIVACVSLEPETARVRIERLVLVDDCGRAINPMLVDGQLTGGAVQGLGETLLEQVVHGPDGQLLTGSLLDYAVPRAETVPRLELDRTETLTPRNPLGAKGVGESATVGTPCALANAVIDALRPLGLSEVELPLTPERLWRLINARPAE